MAAALRTEQRSAGNPRPAGRPLRGVAVSAAAWPVRATAVDARALLALRVAVASALRPAPIDSPHTWLRLLPQQRATAAETEATPAPEGEQATVMSIVRRAQDGDPDAFGELYDRYIDLVYRYVYFRVAGHALAEDLTSETFLRALRRIGSFQWQGRDFGAWLVTIARNLIADHYKSGRYRLEVATGDILETGGDRATDGPEGEVLDGLTNAELLEAVRQLGSEQQECIVLRFLHGLSVAETAAAMGKNEGAIKALQYRAVRSLGRLLPADLLG